MEDLPRTPATVDRRALRQRGIRHGLKQWRDLATRYAKRASLHRSSLALIAAVIWLR
ncbi:hypothetical protein [Micromonospora zamorensis]|uniref:hypothetical protein n=1 Tax=Micromonospora zamorensis TaxID=709883 RepID=UPI0033A06799